MTGTSYLDQYAQGNSLCNRAVYATGGKLKELRSWTIVEALHMKHHLTCSNVHLSSLPHGWAHITQWNPVLQGITVATFRYQNTWCNIEARGKVSMKRVKVLPELCRKWNAPFPRAYWKSIFNKDDSSQSDSKSSKPAGRFCQQYWVRSTHSIFQYAVGRDQCNSVYASVPQASIPTWNNSDQALRY